MKALLVLEDGTSFPCRSFTGPGKASGEIVFNTSMTGYQEILTDPSYSGQMVTMTYPLIGNYGVNSTDMESEKIHARAFLMREYQENHSNFRAETSLGEFLRKAEVLGVDDLDTRALVRHIRQKGAMRAIISTHGESTESLVEEALSIPEMAGCDLAEKVSRKDIRLWENNAFSETPVNSPDKDIWRHKKEGYRVIALDFGIKHNILRNLENAGCRVIVAPAFTSPAEIIKMEPDGLFFSNGPGDPEPVVYAAELAKELLGRFPMFGICLGHQILGLALGCKTYKLKFGHRGGNQPVKNLMTGRVEITSQNHGFAVDQETLSKDDIELTHINLNDNTCEGFRHKTLPVFAVQYHPEAAPGPHDAHYLFKEFTSLMEKAG